MSTDGNPKLTAQIRGLRPIRAAISAALMIRLCQLFSSFRKSANGAHARYTSSSKTKPLVGGRLG